MTANFDILAKRARHGGVLCRPSLFWRHASENGTHAAIACRHLQLDKREVVSLVRPFVSPMAGAAMAIDFFATQGGSLA
jgi:hypothetical protein